MWQSGNRQKIDTLLLWSLYFLDRYIYSYIDTFALLELSIVFVFLYLFLAIEIFSLDWCQVAPLPFRKLYLALYAVEYRQTSCDWSLHFWTGTLSPTLGNVPEQYIFFKRCVNLFLLPRLTIFYFYCVLWQKNWSWLVFPAYLFSFWFYSVIILWISLLYVLWSVRLYSSFIHSC